MSSEWVEGSGLVFRVQGLGCLVRKILDPAWRPNWLRSYCRGNRGCEALGLVSCVLKVENDVCSNEQSYHLAKVDRSRRHCTRRFACGLGFRAAFVGLRQLS